MNWTILRLNLVLGVLLALVSLSSGLSAQNKSAQPKKEKPEAPRIIRKSNSALQSSAINRVEAMHSPQALAARIFGSVQVEVTIDESGSVVTARAVSGNQLLRESAVEAARGWTFAPAIVEGTPVKVMGTLTFNFNLPDYVVRDNAIERLKRQAKSNPSDAILQFRLGRAFEDNEQFPEALKCYSQAIKLNPEYGEAHVAIGNLKMKLNQYEGALEAYKQSVTLDLPRETRANANRAIALIYFRSDRFAEAVEPFKQAIALAPQGQMYFNLGLTYLKLGDKASATQQYQLLKERNSILAAQLLKQINEAK